MNDETVAMIIVLPTFAVAGAWPFKMVLGMLAFWELAVVRNP